MNAPTLVGPSLLLAAATATPAAAFLAPDWRGEAQATYQAWDNPASQLFGDYPGPYEPDAAIDNANGTASMEVSNHIQTSTGNIYDFAAPWDITVTVPDFGLGSGYDTEVWVQVLIVDFGNDLDTSSVLINGLPATLMSGTIETDEYLFMATTPGNAAQTLVTFNSADASTGLDRLTIDTRAVLASIDLPGDTDGDGDIDNADLQAAIANFTGPGGAGKTSAQGDTDGDGDVDNADLQAAIAGFTGPNATPVPEPASMALLGLGGAALLRRRRD